MVVPPTYDDVLADVARRTPVHTSSLLDRRCGATTLLKCENFQRTGSFKFRGAFTAVSALSPARREAGVVAFSSGNHAQALACAARLHSTQATIVMPTDAPASKVAATVSHGARLVRYDRYTQDRAAIAAEVVERTGASLVPPFDHPGVIAGQGTAAAELFTDVPDLDVLLVPLGGGGLLAGTLLSAQALSPATEVYGVEPAAGDDARRSLRAGSIVTIDPPRTIADGAQTTRVGEHTFPIIVDHVTDILTVDDGQLIEAMQFLATRTKLVVEPTGALGVAAAMANRTRFTGRRVGVIVSGGNVDLARLAASTRTSS